ncbi:MAG: DUF4139 domain-containing protein [Polyangiaceae bacterium]
MEQVSSTIEQVTVYHHGARIRRRVHLSWTDRPPYSIEVVDLPLALEDATVRARVERVDGDAIIDATNLRIGLYVPPAPEVGEVPDRESLRRVMVAIEHNEEAQSQLRHELEQLREIEVPERPEGEEGKPAPQSPMSSRLALEQILDGATVDRQRELRTLEQKRRDLDREAADLQRKISLASTAREFKPHELRKSLTIDLHRRNGDSKGASIVIEYLVAGAKWVPAYQCRMDREGRRADIVMRAHVVQRTGEDWRAVRLTLSTASAIAWTELPELNAIKIGKVQATPARRGVRPPPVGATSLFQDFDRERVLVNALTPATVSFEAPDGSVGSRPSLGGASSSQGRASPKKRARPRVEVDMMEMERGPSRDSPFAEISDDDIDTLFEEDESEGVDDALEISAPEAEPAAAYAPAPAPAAMPYGPPPAPKPQASMAKMSMAGLDRGGLGSADGFASDLAAVDGFESTRYAMLRLASPLDSNLRTKLSRTDAADVYASTLARRGRVVKFADAMALINQVRDEATRLKQLSLPTGGFDVRAASGHFDYAYETDASVDVPSDGSFHSIPVGVRSAEADEVRRRAARGLLGVSASEHHEPLRAPLLPGPVEVYVAGDYVLTTSLPMVGANGDFKLGLGVEQSIMRPQYFVQ